MPACRKPSATNTDPPAIISTPFQVDVVKQMKNQPEEHSLPYGPNYLLSMRDAHRKPYQSLRAPAPFATRCSETSA